MNTKIIQIKDLKEASLAFEEAGELLKKGELVAFPTETVYGLGAFALDGQALKKIYLAKGRPADNPLIVHIADFDQIETLARDIPPQAFRLRDYFWPGPLTLVFKKNPRVPDIVTGGLDTVAVRIPAHPVAQELLRRSGLPLAAPSANLSGRPSPTTAEHVWEDLQGKIPLILDAGQTQVGLESTVLDLTRDRPIILRPGGVTQKDLQSALGEEVLTYQEGVVSGPALSPGMKYRHYTPGAEVILLEGDVSFCKESIYKIIQKKRKQGKKVVVLGHRVGDVFGEKYISLGKNPSEIAYNIFAYFRELDQKGYDTLLIEGVEDAGIGSAIMNRLRKSASEIVSS